MSRHEGTSMVRCARWLGLDRNPMRRRTVRIEAAIRLATLILLLLASPPPGQRTIAGDVCIAAVTTCLVTSLLVLGSSTLARRALDRRRSRAWDAEWRATGPRWSGHRS